MATSHTRFRDHASPLDEALEVVDVLADSGVEGTITWLLRLIGPVAVLAGLGLWLLTDAALLVLPAVLLVVGLVLLVALSEPTG